MFSLNYYHIQTLLVNFVSYHYYIKVCKYQIRQVTIQQNLLFTICPNGISG